MLDSYAFFRGLKDVLGVLAPSDIAFQEVVTKYFVHFAREGKSNIIVKLCTSSSIRENTHWPEVEMDN